MILNLNLNNSIEPATTDAGVDVSGLKLNGNSNKKQQTNPPSIPICELYADGEFPVGEIHEYKSPKHLNK